MGPATERQPSANPGPEDDPADLTRICWTQWLRAQEAGQACDRPPRVLPPSEPDDEALWRRLLGDE